MASAGDDSEVLEGDMAGSIDNTEAERQLQIEVSQDYRREGLCARTCVCLCVCV